MTTQVMIPKTFEERMKERIKESIGELITDEELSKLVNRSIKEVFFKPIIVKEGYRERETPSFLNTIIKELLADKVKLKVQEYIDTHPDEVLKAIQETLSIGVGTALIGALNSMFQNQIWNLQTSLESVISNRS